MPSDALSPTPAAARQAMAGFSGLSAEIRGCALLGPDGVLAASGEPASWLEPAERLLRAADAAAGGRASQAHVATEAGEAYLVREAGLALVAVTDRFTLASLVLADMRATLRGLSNGAVPAVAEAA